MGKKDPFSVIYLGGAAVVFVLSCAISGLGTGIVSTLAYCFIAIITDLSRR